MWYQIDQKLDKSRVKTFVEIESLQRMAQDAIRVIKREIETGEHDSLGSQLDLSKALIVTALGQQGGNLKYFGVAQRDGSTTNAIQFTY